MSSNSKSSAYSYQIVLITIILLGCSLKVITQFGHILTKVSAEGSEFIAGLPWWSSGSECPGNAGDTGSIPGPENPTGCRASECVCHNYWASTLEPKTHGYWSPHALDPVIHSKRSHSEKCSQLGSNLHLPQLKNALVRQWRPSTAIINIFFLKNYTSGFLLVLPFIFLEDKSYKIYLCCHKQLKSVYLYCCTTSYCINIQRISYTINKYLHCF